MINKETIEMLLEKGFDPELISFELDIPIEELNRIKSEMERKDKSSLLNSGSRKTDNKNQSIYSKMEPIRQKYKEIFEKSNKPHIREQKGLSEEETELINSTITKIEELIEEMKLLSGKERRQKAKILLTEIRKIEDYQLTIEQSEKLYSLLQSGELRQLSSDVVDNIDSNIENKRRMAIRSLIKAIDIAQSQSEDIDELESLNKKLISKMRTYNKFAIETVRRKIENKISEIKSKKVIKENKDDIPQDIEHIIKELANGTLDTNEANEIIDKEAKRRVDSRTRNKFSLTEEQTRKQILTQIRNNLKRKSQQYDIQDAEKTIMQLKNLCGESAEESPIETVVESLINAKRYEKAKEVCEHFYKEDENILFSRLKKQIRNHEFGDSILQKINTNRTIEEENVAFEQIERLLNISNVRLGSIPLGKSKDGLRDITLADIWIDEKKKGQPR